MNKEYIIYATIAAVLLCIIVLFIIIFKQQRDTRLEFRSTNSSVSYDYEKCEERFKQNQKQINEMSENLNQLRKDFDSMYKHLDTRIRVISHSHIGRLYECDGALASYNDELRKFVENHARKVVEEMNPKSIVEVEEVRIQNEEEMEITNP